MSSCSNLVTLLHSLPTSARSWTTCLPAIPLWPHWWMSQQHQTPVQGSGTVPLGAASSLLTTRHCLQQDPFHCQQFPHQWAGSPTQPCRGLAGSSWSCPDTGPEQCLEPLCQAILPLRFLDLVSSEPGCTPCPRPTSSPESATTPIGHNHHEDYQGPHSTTPWVAPFTATSDQFWLPFWPWGPCSGISQTITNATSMAADIATMANVIPNVPLKLQQRIIQGEFIDLSELLQADFQF